MVFRNKVENVLPTPTIPFGSHSTSIIIFSLDLNFDFVGWFDLHCSYYIGTEKIVKNFESSSFS